MNFLLDTAHVDSVKRCCEFFPVAGVTTNPTIISKENTDFKSLIYTIRDIIGFDRMLHIQTTSTEAKDIVKEAVELDKLVGRKNFFIKIPITAEGLKAAKECKEAGIGVTMTAIFTQTQALIASNAGADYVAPYINRLDNIVSDGVHVVSEIAEVFRMNNVKTKILAASFKNVEQIHKVALTGADSVTINPDIFDMLIYHPLTYYAIDDFDKDWETVYGDKKILDLIK